MLLGWHYSEYYSNAYALNQYLASRGFVVLSINYRLGIGYGHDFHRPRNAGPRGPRSTATSRRRASTSGASPRWTPAAWRCTAGPTAAT